MELDEMHIKPLFFGLVCFVVELQLNPYTPLINKVSLQRITNFVHKAPQSSLSGRINFNK